MVDDNEYYDPEAQLFFTTADVDGDEVRIYSKRSMAEIDEKYGQVIARDRHRVVIAKRQLSRETPVDQNPRQSMPRRSSESIDPVSEGHLEPYRDQLLQPNRLEPDESLREGKGVPPRFKNEQDELLGRRDDPPSPNEKLVGFVNGGFMHVPNGTGSDGAIQNPQTGEWHELVNGVLNPISIEQQELHMSERQEARRIKATTGQMIRGALDTAGKAMTGGYANMEVATARYQACLACEHFNINSSRCSLCGCFMRAKVKVALSTCPASPSRWPQ